MIITPTLECGGAERFVSLLCNHIDTPRLQLSLVVINNSNPFYAINPAVKIIDLGAGRVSRSFFKLRKLIKSEGPDIVFTTANHLNLFAAMLKPWLSNKIIWIARETSVVSINSRYARYPGFYNLLLKSFYKKLDHIICQSAFMQDDLIKNYGVGRTKTSVIHNAVDPSLKYYNGSVMPYTFITVARLSKEKGIDGLLRTVASLGVPFQYCIVGDGPEKKNLQQLAQSLGLQDSVHFAGQLDKPFAGKEYSQVYLMGSLYEGFPNAVIEANAIGMPAVSKNVPGGIAEIITDSHNGFIASDDNDFRRKILMATTYPFNREEISKSAIRRFSIEKMTTAVAELFSKLYGLKGK